MEQALTVDRCSFRYSMSWNRNPNGLKNLWSKQLNTLCENYPPSALSYLLQVVVLVRSVALCNDVCMSPSSPHIILVLLSLYIKCSNFLHPPCQSFRNFSPSLLEALFREVRSRPRYKSFSSPCCVWFSVHLVSLLSLACLNIMSHKKLTIQN